MIFAGFLLFLDPPEGGRPARPWRRLRPLGVQLKIITGDNRLVAAHLAAAGRPAPSSAS